MPDNVLIGAAFLILLIVIFLGARANRKRLAAKVPAESLEFEGEPPEPIDTKMQVDNIRYHEGVLEVKCSGEYGVGSDGNPSADLLAKKIALWIADHPDRPVVQIDVDYSEVDYSWGDGPLSSMFPFIAEGVTKIRLIASSQNRESLESLVGTPGRFEVVAEDDRTTLDHSAQNVVRIETHPRL
jgi:hypothetical protein